MPCKGKIYSVHGDIEGELAVHDNQDTTTGSIQGGAGVRPAVSTESELDLRAGDEISLLNFFWPEDETATIEVEVWLVFLDQEKGEPEVIGVIPPHGVKGLVAPEMRVYMYSEMFRKKVFPEESHIDGGAYGELGQIFGNNCTIQACKVCCLQMECFGWK